MSGLRYAEVSQRELKFLDMTSLTVEEFGELVQSFEEAFQERMQEWRLDGKRRSGRAGGHDGQSVPLLRIQPLR